MIFGSVKAEVHGSKVIEIEYKIVSWGTHKIKIKREFKIEQQLGTHRRR